MTLDIQESEQHHKLNDEQKGIGLNDYQKKKEG